jgi:GNAT superfamily N-acetyltransferase
LTNLVKLDYPQSSQVLRRTHKIWSGGLSYFDYQTYFANQKNSTWGRHLELYGLVDENSKVLSSAKLYRLNARYRQKPLSLAGIGAVFTAPEERGKGYAAKLISSLVDAVDQFDGALLFSDIGADFYNRLGFFHMGSAAFNLTLKSGQAENKSLAADIVLEPLSMTSLDELDRHYRQWQARQIFSIERELSYWQYKADKEFFLHQRSQLGWPQLLTLRLRNKGGYALLECGGATLRILEIIDWQDPQIFFEAIKCLTSKFKTKKLRGWESTLKSLYPGFHLDSIFRDSELYFEERSWGHPMLAANCALMEDCLNEVFDLSPSPFLELDHL